MAIYSTHQMQSLTLKPHLLAFHVQMGYDTIPTSYRRKKKKVVAALKTEDHSYLEAFTKDTNTQDKLQRMGKYSFWICMEQSNNLIWTSAPSSWTTWSHQ